MNYPRFLGYELVAATVWNTAFCVLGYLLAGEIDHLQMLIERAGWVLLGVLVILFLAWRGEWSPAEYFCRWTSG